MPKYIDLLEQRTALKATKEQMFKLGYQQKDLDAIDAKINQLSIDIRSLEPDETPTIIIVSDDFVHVDPPKITPLDYKTFCEFYKDKVITSITDQLNSINVPIGVYAIFKNTVVKSEDYIMKHHYNIYCSEVESRNKWIIHK